MGGNNYQEGCYAQNWQDDDAHT